MKHIVNIVITLLLVTSCQTHKKALGHSKKSDYHFNNQGEQENYWALNLFKHDYKKQKTTRYLGTIKIINDKQIQYGKDTLTLNESSKFKAVFITGLFYPKLVSNDNLIIIGLEEQPFLSHSAKARRFKLILGKPVFSNPTVYFFELTNNNATINMDIDDFIKGADLTFIKEGWVDI